MGSLFKSPSVPQVTPVTFTASSNDVAQKTQQSDENQIDIETSEDSAVRDVVRRVSRGRNSTIQTSYRGVLDTNNALVPQRKSLLGE